MECIKFSPKLGDICNYLAYSLSVDINLLIYLLIFSSFNPYSKNLYFCANVRNKKILDGIFIVIC